MAFTEWNQLSGESLAPRYQGDHPTTYQLILYLLGARDVATGRHWVRG